jgi:DDE superfamily endonuclease
MFFIDYGSTTLYFLYVRSPLTTAADAEHNSQEYSVVAGFPVAISSTDATHIMLERVQYRYRQAHLGFKMTHTARTYNITVNHRRRIHSTTRGHPARWNDKTVALFDDLMQALHQGSILDDVPFELYVYDSSGAAVVKQKYRGAWLLVDNGYLAHPTTVPPIKTTNSRAEIRFLAWLESLRKDVECTFGILKGRWRILKTDVRLHGVEAAHKIFSTCCAPHNWLLEEDGLDERWEEVWLAIGTSHQTNKVMRVVMTMRISFRILSCVFVIP